MPLRAGLIGCGSLGRVHTDCLSKIDEMKMVAFCDLDEQRAERLCREFGGQYATADVDRLLEDDTLDARVVSGKLV